MPELGRRIAAGREATIYEWEDGRVLRLFQRAGAEADAAREMTAMRAAAACLPVPEVFELVQHDGRAGIVMERVDGIDMLTELERKPWRAYSAGAALGRLHVRMLRCRADTALPSVHERVRGRTERSGAAPAWLAVLTGSLLDALPEGDALGHGDFHPGNVIATAAGPKIIDWPNATRCDPLADVARTRVILSTAELPEGTPVAVWVLSRGLRRAVLAGYDRAIGAGMPVDRRRLRRWELVQAVERLGEASAGERAGLERYIRARIDLDA